MYDRTMAVNLKLFNLTTSCCCIGDNRIIYHYKVIGLFHVKGFISAIYYVIWL